MMLTRELLTAKRQDYLRGTVSHQDYYLDMARHLGYADLRRIVLALTTPAVLTAAMLSGDEHFNAAVPLVVWDAQHGTVRPMAYRAGYPAWSLSDTVCVLKAVARDIATELRRPVASV
jgi:hypothetical protein